MRSTMPTVSTAIVKNDFELILLEGVSQKQLEEKTGLKREQLKYSDEQLPIWHTYKLMEAASELAESKAFALHMGENTDSKSLGIFGNIIMNCRTIRSMVDPLVRYYKIARELTKIDTREDKSLFYLSFEVEAPKSIEHHIVEKFFATAISLIRTFTETDANPEEVRFRHSHPGYKDEYQRIFRCPVIFDHFENVICIKKEYLDVEYPRHNPDLKEILSNHAENLLNRHLLDSYFHAQVRKVIIEHLHKGFISIDMISDYFNMSRWTLNRKLSKEGTSFQDILNQTREELAVSYLKYSRFTNTEISFLLGFSDPYSFPKAFKRWYGKSVSEYRDTLKSIE